MRDKLKMLEEGTILVLVVTSITYYGDMDENEEEHVIAYTSIRRAQKLIDLWEKAIVDTSISFPPVKVIEGIWACKAEIRAIPGVDAAGRVNKLHKHIDHYNVIWSDKTFDK